jgi:sarcosine oxidase
MSARRGRVRARTLPPVGYDVAVIGLGAMGSAVAWNAARLGADVLGIDRFAPPHPHGSTHGDTRITRLALGEGAAYVPLARRSHELWRELEAQTGERLLEVTGGVVLSAPGGRGQHGAEDFLGTTIASARAHGVDVEELDAAGIAAHLPPFALRGDERGSFEPSAGFVRPERAVAAQLALARELGADLRTGVVVRSVGDGRIESDDGTFTADRIVLAAGPWLAELRPELAGRFTVTRQPLHWFALAPGAYAAHRDLPVFVWLTGDGPEEMFYGFPAIDGPGGGLKVATEQFAQTTTPEACARDVAPGESRAMHERYLAERLPGLLPEAVRATACLYTSTADCGFAIGPPPGDETLIVVSACSGHGFKHSAAIGEAVAQLAVDGSSNLDLAPFGLAG